MSNADEPRFRVVESYGRAELVPDATSEFGWATRHTDLFWRVNGKRFDHQPTAQEIDEAYAVSPVTASPSPIIEPVAKAIYAEMDRRGIGYLGEYGGSSTMKGLTCVDGDMDIGAVAVAALKALAAQGPSVAMAAAGAREANIHGEDLDPTLDECVAIYTAMLAQAVKEIEE